MKRLLTILLLVLAGPALAQGDEAVPTASELLAAMDDNLQFETRTSTTTMQVITSRRTREYRMLTYGRGLDEAAVEYLAPDREKGTRMLKRGDELWLYLPRAERTQKISGHMLRQGMMGSDISYEDMMESNDFEEMYEATVLGAEEVEGRSCWKVEAIGRDNTVTYPKRVFWIDKEHLIPVRQELYALSGMMLKVWTMSEVEQHGDRWVPMHMEIADQLREGSKTVLHIEDMTFGVALEDEVFSKRWLERQ
ncbi:MAG: outer membrane lipoprotein-sorting protein [Deltaproteobacteria bacterium]|nr:outer membrane lipoprotein-sorting protein [Deltaproteobacteria bacterium]